MKTNLLLSDKTKPTKLALANLSATTFIPREPEAVAGCNCDRWGHPCPGCNERKVQPKAELAISSDNQTT